MENRYAESITNEALSLLPTGAFPGEIVVVDTPEAVAEACRFLQAFAVVGFDTETRPSFTKGIQNKVSLLQLSAGDRAYLFRLHLIGLPAEVRSLLAAPHIAKVGAAVTDDVRMLRQVARFTPKNFVELQHLAPRYGITDKSLRKLAALVLGIRISKAQRLSNWEARQLTPPQQLYAATDAWVGREVYLGLQKATPLSPSEPTSLSEEM
ncbi:MAG: 3'-5' exonuclease domain-containing protein 2 [Alistipes sp.]|nr:3'-5' exonuclease domain-containing protein 2 [Alistipes sp.]